MTNLNPPHRRKLLHLAVGAAALIMPTSVTLAQNWPAQPATMVVPFAAGGGTDVFCRPLAAQIGEELFDDLDGPVIRVAAKDVPMPFSPPLERFVLPGPDAVIAAVRRLL